MKGDELMNFYTRLKNNFKYAYHRKLMAKAIAKMEEHIHDSDDREFKKWGNIALNSAQICIEIPLK